MAIKQGRGMSSRTFTRPFIKPTCDELLRPARMTANLFNMVSAIPIEPSQGVRSVEPSVLRPYWLAVTLVGESKIILLAAYPTIIY